MNNKHLFFLICLFAMASLSAQISIKGTVKDIDTQKPLSCAKINIYSEEMDTVVYTREDGSFIISNFPKADNYCIDIFRDDYRYFDTCYSELSSDNLTINALLYSYDSPNYRITDIAKQDAFNLGFAFYLYSPSIENSDKSFSSNTYFQIYNCDFHFKLANKFQMGFKITPIELSWTKFKYPDTLYTKERYFGASGGLSLYFRYIPTTIKSSGGKGLFFDLGAAYSLPYYYAHSGYTDKYNRISTRHIKNYNDVQAMFRVGYSWWSINANYRFTNVLKGTYIETPKLTLGIELLLPMNN